MHQAPEFVLTPLECTYLGTEACRGTARTLAHVPGPWLPDGGYVMTRIDARLRVAAAGEYTFWLTAVDGAELRVGGVLIGSHAPGQAAVTLTGSVCLVAGLQPLGLGLCAKAGAASAVALEYAGPDFTRRPVPGWALCPGGDPPGFEYSWYSLEEEGVSPQWDPDGATPTESGWRTRWAEIPHPDGLGVLICHSTLWVPATGTYTLHLRTVLQGWLWIGDVQRVHCSDASTRASADTWLAAGEHPLKLVLVSPEDPGCPGEQDIVEVEWEGPGLPRQALEGDAISCPTPPGHVVLYGAQVRLAPGVYGDGVARRAHLATGADPGAETLWWYLGPPKGCSGAEWEALRGTPIGSGDRFTLLHYATGLALAHPPEGPGGGVTLDAPRSDRVVDCAVEVPGTAAHAQWRAASTVYLRSGRSGYLQWGAGLRFGLEPGCGAVWSLADARAAAPLRQVTGPGHEVYTLEARTEVREGWAWATNAVQYGVGVWLEHLVTGQALAAHGARVGVSGDDPQWWVVEAPGSEGPAGRAVRYGETIGLRHWDTGEYLTDGLGLGDAPGWWTLQPCARGAHEGRVWQLSDVVRLVRDGGAALGCAVSAPRARAAPVEAQSAPGGHDRAGPTGLWRAGGALPLLRTMDAVMLGLGDGEGLLGVGPAQDAGYCRVAAAPQGAGRWWRLRLPECPGPGPAPQPLEPGAVVELQLLGHGREDETWVAGLGPGGGCVVQERGAGTAPDTQRWEVQPVDAQGPEVAVQDSFRLCSAANPFARLGPAGSAATAALCVRRWDRAVRYGDVVRLRTCSRRLAAPAVAEGARAAAVALPLPQPRPAAALQGVHFWYYAGEWGALPDFASLTPSAAGTLPQFAGEGHDGADAHFAYLFEAELDVPEGGLWQFYTQSADGSRLFLEGALVVDNIAGNALKEAAGPPLTLSRGLHRLQVCSGAGS